MSGRREKGLLASILFSKERFRRYLEAKGQRLISQKSRLQGMPLTRPQRQGPTTLREESTPSTPSRIPSSIPSLRTPTPLYIQAGACSST